MQIGRNEAATITAHGALRRMNASRHQALETGVRQLGDDNRLLMRRRPRTKIRKLRCNLSGSSQKVRHGKIRLAFEFQNNTE